ncbi:hypothetical protein AK812_SmicGene23148 [Symbiodinium microadriaticum]|uniref:Uncharacterized protein n=1 Tax=Symbiodinium microadriaticum TaxID=2951 RepID=A0A1Q9DI09_SYMMI|nr:hypothetical protein AK812_SmicGene23148 [Symbiodinium microadriaticum]
MVSVVVDAEDMVAKGDSSLEDVLQTLAWPAETLAREVMVRLHRSGYDAETDEGFELRRLLLRTFLGSSSTKEVLESTFSHLHDISARHAKNAKMCMRGVWFYSVASPYASRATCGMAQCRPTHAEWVKWRGFYGSARDHFMKRFNKAFNVNGTELPRGRELPISPKGVTKTKWRLAGPLSHYRSSSAMLYLLEDSGKNFANCHLAWAGAFLRCGQFYWHKDLQTNASEMMQDQESFMLCLGFNGWCALGVDIMPEEVNGREYLTLSRGHLLNGLRVMFNFDCARDSCPWTHVAVQMLPPACLPSELVHCGIAFEVLDKDGWILKDALASGMQLTVERLRQACQSVGAELLPRGAGSGKNGNMIKVDWVSCLVSAVFGSETAEKQAAIEDKLMGRHQKPVDVSVLAAISELDSNNAEAFKDMKKRAQQMFESAVYGQGVKQGLGRMLDGEPDEEKRKANFQKAVGNADKEVAKKAEADRQHAERQFQLTPPDLKSLLPGGGEHAGVCWARYNPFQKWFSVQYPVSDVELQDSMQRKWETARCPNQIDALRTVLEFAYNRWNSLNPTCQSTMPTDAELQRYLDTL